MAGLWSLVDPAKPWSYPDIFPQSLSFERWKIVWETTSLPEAMFNSYTIAPTVSLITILLSLPTAYAFGRMEFRGKKLAELLTLIPLVIPGLGRRRINVRTHSRQEVRAKATAAR